MRNIGEILEAAGGGYKDVIKTTVLMKDGRIFCRNMKSKWNF